MDGNSFNTTSITDTVTSADFQNQLSVEYSYPNMDVNSNFTMTDTSSFLYDKTIPQYVTSAQNVNHRHDLISTPNVIGQQNDMLDLGHRERIVNTSQTYLPSTVYGDPTQMLNVAQYENKIRHTSSSYTGGVNKYQQSHNYLYNPQETVAANQTVISNPFTGFAQYPQPITSQHFPLESNLHDIGEIIPSVDYTTTIGQRVNTNVTYHNSQNSTSLLTNSQNNNQVSFADILLDQSSSLNTTSFSSTSFSASDLEVLSSCFQITESSHLTSSEHSVNPEIMLNGAQTSELLYPHFQQSEVGANEDCVTSETYEKVSDHVPNQVIEDDRTTMMVSCNDDKNGREKKKSVIVWDDVTSLPQKISLPLPSYCNCQNIEIDMEQKIKQQSYFKNKKELVLHHVGRVVINDIELCSFVRNGTAYVSHAQLFATGIFNKAALQLFSTCGRSFPSFVDRLLVEERDYMKQKGFLSQTSTKTALFSVGFVGWIIDYLNRDVNDKERTIIYEKYIGHQCSKYETLKSWQDPTPLPIPTRTYIRTKPKHKTTGSNMITTCLVEDEKTEQFTIAEIGRLMYSDKILAAFMLDDGREIVYVNLYQSVVYATCLTLADFYSLVNEFNCRLLTSPDGVKSHFKALKQHIPEAFLQSEWIRLSSFMQICSFLLGRLDHKHPAKIFINQILKSKPREVFGPDLKISLAKITFPETETRILNSADILSIAAASADIGTDITPNDTAYVTSLPQSQLQLKKVLVSKSRLKKTSDNFKKKRGRPQKKFHLWEHYQQSQTDEKKLPTEEQNDLQCKDETSDSVANLRDVNSTPALSTVTSDSYSVSKSGVSQGPPTLSEAQYTSTDVNCGSKIVMNYRNCELKVSSQSSSTELDNGVRRKMKVDDVKLSTDLKNIKDQDFLNDSYELDSSSPDKLRIDLSASRTDVSTPVKSQGENICNGRLEHTIMSNSKVTVIANNTGEEIFECVPLFSLADIVHKDEENMLNPYSPLKSIESRDAFLKSQLEENGYPESMNNQSSAKNKNISLDSFEDSFGPMKKGCINSNADLKTLNAVILGEEPSDWILSPQKSTNTMTSMFDTPKTSPCQDRSGTKTPRIKSFCQKFNRLEREATPKTSLHFFAEIASASEDMTENNPAVSKKKTRSTFPVKLLKNVSKVSNFLNKNLNLSKAVILQDKFTLDIKLQKNFMKIYQNAENDPCMMQSFQKLLKLTVLLLSKICTISELQRKVDELKRRQTRSQSEIPEELEQGEIIMEFIPEPCPLQTSIKDINIDNNMQLDEQTLSQNSVETSQIVGKSPEVTLCKPKGLKDVDSVKDNSHQEKATLVSECVLNEEKRTNDIPQQCSSSPEKSSPSKQKSRKRKLKDIFPQNEDKELAPILTREQESSDVDINSSSSKKSKLTFVYESEKAVVRNESMPAPTNNLISVSKKSTGENLKYDCENLNKDCENSIKYCENLNKDCENLNKDCEKKDCENLNKDCENLNRDCENLRRNGENPEKYPSLLQRLLSRQSPDSGLVIKTSNCISSPKIKKKYPNSNKILLVTSETQTVAPKQSGLRFGKRIRKKPAKFTEECLPSPKRKRSPKKKNKMFPEDYYKNKQFYHKLMKEKSLNLKKIKTTNQTSDDDSNSELAKNQEIFVYLPPNSLIDESTELIPASKFRRYSKKMKDMLKEGVSEQEEVVLNNSNVLTDPQDGFHLSIINSNEKKSLPSPGTNHVNRKSAMGSGVSENGEKYEIFQSV